MTAVMSLPREAREGVGESQAMGVQSVTAVMMLLGEALPGLLVGSGHGRQAHDCWHDAATRSLARASGSPNLGTSSRRLQS